MRAHGAAKRGAGEGGLHGWMGRDFGVCSGVLIYFWKLLRGRRKVAKHINTHTSHRVTMQPVLRVASPDVDQMCVVPRSPR